jgi:hypothetical protein
MPIVYHSHAGNNLRQEDCAPPRAYTGGREVREFHDCAAKAAPSFGDSFSGVILFRGEDAWISGIYEEAFGEA